MTKKFEKDEALAKIKALISNFYEKVGREDLADADYDRAELVEDIEDILNNTDIPSKNVIIETLELEKELKKKLLLKNSE